LFLLRLQTIILIFQTGHISSRIVHDEAESRP